MKSYGYRVWPPDGGYPNVAFKMKTELMLLAAFAVQALLLQGCGKPRPAAVKQTFLVMGTVGSVSLPYEAAADLEDAVRLVVDTMTSIERKLSIYRADSEVSRLNMRAGTAPVPVSGSTMHLLELAKYYSELSGGAFDVTTGPLLKAWGLSGGLPVPERPLSEETLEDLRRLVGWRHIILSGNTAFLEKRGVEIDLGGIAKGSAVDEACRRLLEHGVRNALVDLGGDIGSLGYRRNTEPWLVGIRNPFRPDELLGAISLSGGEAVATSGNYERFVMIDGTRYPHIVDPRTGRPAQGMASVTVVSRSAVEADALSTALFVQGSDRGLATLHKTGSRAAMFIPDRSPLEMHVTPEFAARFTPASPLSGAVYRVEPGFPE